MTFKDYRDIVRQMEREMQQMSDDAFRGFFGIATLSAPRRFWQPSVDVHETEDSLLVKAELAGARADDLQVSLSSDDRVLTISGARAEPSAVRDGRVRCHQLEIYFGPFERAVALPAGIPLDRERLTASYKDGFLTIMLPKRVLPARAESRLIPIHEDTTTTESE